MFARYLLELALVEFRMLKFVPSNVGASALYLANKIMNRESWNEHLHAQSRYEEGMLRPCARDLLQLF
jgi:hypothetical protein